MKFRNGYWLMRTGVTEYAAAQVCDYSFREGTLTLYCSVKPVESRSATVDAALLTIEMKAVGKNSIAVHAYHHIGGHIECPQFSIAQAQSEATLTQSENELRLTAGTICAVIQKKPFHIRYYEGNSLLTESEGHSLAYLSMPDGSIRFKEELALSVDELVYGLGERFTPFVKNGQTVELYNADGGTASEQTYKNIPFYLSSRGYGIWIHTPAPVSLEIASEKVERVQFSVEGEELSYCVIASGGAENPYHGVLANYTRLSGQAALPPRWSFGLWFSTSFVTDYDEKTVLGFLDGMEKCGIPVEVFHFDCCWMKEFEWCSFQWREDCFPDPEGLLRKIHERGIRVCVWINPYIAQKSPLFREAAAAGYLLRRTDGRVWQTDKWQAGMGIVDFTNPQAVQWYQEQLRALLRMGVDSFKTDFGERIPEDVVYYDGSDPVRMHNYYTLMYNRTVYELLKQEKGAEDAVVFARSATSGSQAYPVHWGGDCASSYRSMAESLRGGLSLALSGIGFWSHDMGGFEDDACTPDLYKRWTQFGLLSTHSRYHSSRRYKAPWLYDEEAVRISRQFTCLKLSLMPYLWAQAVESVRDGLPMLRPMLLEFPQDEMCRYLDRQYMLGRDLLVAPVFSPDGMVKFYLPEGGWIHLIDGRTYVGGRWYTQHFDYDSLPVFVRSGAVLIRSGEERKSAEYDDRHNARICIYDVPMEGTSAACYDRKGQEVASVRVTRNEEQLVVVAHGFDKESRVVLDGQEYPLAGDVLVLV